eukprot:TRINITY_DN4788_c0_g3_i1.p1 TRINITY_DN4788_c0_g3~~TRINITY_DN4788_c0_g3_i1.p1  ORF type:complete len:1345 (+),score=342.19 TRINITY_DN4788_c0_g3_i1:151-4035(+)
MGDIQLACQVLELGAVGLVSATGSESTIVMEQVLRPFAMPVAGVDFSDPTNEFPNVFRMVPDDAEQSRALFATVRHFGWKRMATIHQMDNYGQRGLQVFWYLAALAKLQVQYVMLPMEASAEAMRLNLDTNIRAKGYRIIVVNVCCNMTRLGTLVTVGTELGLFATGYGWFFSDGWAALGRLQGGYWLPGVLGTIPDVEVSKDFAGNLTESDPDRDIEEPVDVFAAVTHDAVWALARALASLPAGSFAHFGASRDCARDLPSAAEKSAFHRLSRAVLGQEFVGVSGPITFDRSSAGGSGGVRNNFRVINSRQDGDVAIVGVVKAVEGVTDPLKDRSWSSMAPVVWSGLATETPADRPPEATNYKAMAFKICAAVLVPGFFLFAAGVEVIWKCARSPVAWRGIPYANRLRPILGDVIAGLVKGTIELVSTLMFATLMTPDELQPYLSVFLNYAIFGFVVSQLAWNMLSQYATPVRTCNVSATIFFMGILQRLRENIAGGQDVPNQMVNTLLWASALTTWLSGVMLWTIGALKFTKFLRFLSSPVKLGIQGALGYFLFAQGFSISAGASWLNFSSISDCAVFFETGTLCRWVLTLCCALGLFLSLKKWSWPYTIPLFVILGVGGCHAVLLAAGISLGEAEGAGWLYSRPANAGSYNPFGFLSRLADTSTVSWDTLLYTWMDIFAAATVTPFLSGIVNLLLFETAFSPEHVGRSDLAYEIRIDGWTQLLCAALGGYSTSPTAGGTAVHRAVGARTNWGLFTSVLVHVAFLLVPGSVDVLQYVPKFVVGAISLIVAISMLDASLCGGFKRLSRREYLTVCVTVLMAILVNLNAAIAGGVIFSFALFIHASANTSPICLDVDAGLTSSHVVWGTRGLALVSQLRGAIRVVSLQGYLFFASIQPCLRKAAQTHFHAGKFIFLILDFGSVTGMDDSCPPEFKSFVDAARDVGISVIFAACSEKILKKLRIHMDVPEQEVVTPSGSCCEHHLRRKATANFETSPEVHVVRQAARALESCELLLVLRCMELCSEKDLPGIDEASRELGELLEGPLQKFQRKLRPEERISPRQGELLILSSGVLETTVQLNNCRHERIGEEVVAVYRCISGLRHDVCFCERSGPGEALRAVQNSTLFVIPLDGFEEMGFRDARETLLKRRAEFLANVLHRMKVKVTMLDSRGDFCSREAREFELAAGAPHEASPMGRYRGAYNRLLNRSREDIASRNDSVAVAFLSEVIRLRSGGLKSEVDMAASCTESEDVDDSDDEAVVSKAYASEQNSFIGPRSISLGADWASEAPQGLVI